MHQRLTIFGSAEALGRAAAEEIVSCWSRAAGSTLTLGCPSGRSPRSTYAALAQALAGRAIDGRNIHLVMMDEYVEQHEGSWRVCPAEAHYSCTRFGNVEIRGVLNGALREKIPAENLHVPDPSDPLSYERKIEALGGIDVFVLASGAGDGHVAFNPPGTGVHELTRRVQLAETTRIDNMATFPAFADLAEVPRFGVSVGPGTIVRHARASVMILLGADKGRALRRILDADGYDPAWPSSVVNVCRDSVIFADEAAAHAAAEA